MKGIKHKKPLQTRNGRPRYKAFTIKQLVDAYGKTSAPKIKFKIEMALRNKIKVEGQSRDILLSL